MERYYSLRKPNRSQKTGPQSTGRPGKLVLHAYRNHKRKLTMAIGYRSQPFFWKFPEHRLTEIF
ncbi:hypothetical protein ANCDUO_22293 [Ancylostoma duodenale]|uniref:Uncharacterized protein n=1 Tax=Ancylostoma duodenale TaxID=51022 RepID=A0A0C2CCP8_9BILA|nr:hypothetical protein ANCDUO_22293 [Ancylostoma duodenale]